MKQIPPSPFFKMVHHWMDSMKELNCGGFYFDIVFYFHELCAITRVAKGFEKELMHKSAALEFWQSKDPNLSCEDAVARLDKLLADTPDQQLSQRCCTS